ncbi:MAG: GRP family sugar transporter, partial [Patescibacteria group bacterium]
LSGTKLMRMLLLGLFFSVGSVALLTAYNRGDVSAVAPINQTSIVITTLLAVIFLKERDHLPKKILAAMICFIGALLIAF